MPRLVPKTVPDEEPMEAIAGTLLLHVPPTGVSLRSDVELAQIFGAPLITAGAALIVIVVVAIHPVGRVYVTVVVPPDTAVTKPDEEPMVANSHLLS